ncbi:TOMM precursor leader peptide-binding protein [Haliangium sp.]|uniref:TOMM precursor leader peptide-binding protein n=1 Tax=Haliangium sp. TaxID=2663208 RepID=UPI003D0C3F87
MSEHPRFRSHLRAVVAGDQQVFVVSERETKVLPGRLYACLAPLLDGTRSIEALFKALAEDFAPPEIGQALLYLRQRGYLTGADEPADAELWLAAGIDPEQARQRLADTSVSIHVAAEPGGADSHGGASGPEGERDADTLAQALTELGVTVVESGPGDLEVHLCRDYLRALSALAPAPTRARVFVQPVGTIWWLGPVLGPGGSCHACLRDRLHENRALEAFVRRHDPDAGPLAPRLRFGPVARAALHQAGLVIASWIAGAGSGPLADKLVTVDVTGPWSDHHAVPRRPHCEHCGDPALGPHDASRRPPVLVSRPKHELVGGERLLTAEDVRARLQPHVDPITGFFFRLDAIPSEAHGLTRLWSAAYPACPTEEQPNWRDFFVASWGKGDSDVEAQACALAEALERRCAVFRADVPRRRARAVDLGARAVAPAALELFSERQYREREAAGAPAQDRRLRVWRRLDERAEIEWTPLWSLTHEDHRYLPTQYCYSGYPVAETDRVAGFHSNGDSAGGCLEEAIVQGFFELVERDAVALWWFNRARRPGLDVAAFDEPFARLLGEHVARWGWRLWALDLTTDLGLPAVAAVAAAPDHRQIMVGFSAHLDAGQALRRALSELYQCFDPDDRRRQRQRPGWRDFHLDAHAFLVPDPAAPARGPADYPTLAGDDLLGDLRTCVARAASCGLEVLVLDQSRPELPMTSVKVVAPGMRLFWPRFAPGRLYDVPVELGWVPAALSEDELNPLPIIW